MEESGVVELEVVNCLDLSLVEPLNTLTVLPETEFDLVVLWNDVCSDTVLLTLVPVSFIASAVGPGIDAKSVFLIIFILSLVHSSVVPDVDAHALHVVVEPLALVFTAVEP